MKNVCVVIPTNRPEQFELWLKSWENYLVRNGVSMIVLWDGENKADLGYPFPSSFDVYDWADINKDLGKDAWIIPRHSDTIRSYGFLKAWEQGYDVWTMDDDVRLPQGADPLLSYELEEEREKDITPYFSVGDMTNTSEEMRGYPYSLRHVNKTAVQYGGWSIVPDFDALKQIEHIGQKFVFFPHVNTVPKYQAVTGCIMNAFIPHRWIPAMYQLLMGHEEYEVDRNGDIWSGLFMKKIADHLNEAVVINGMAQVDHIRASNPWESLKREASGYETNELLWEHLLERQPTRTNSADTPLKAYRELAKDLSFFPFKKINHLYPSQLREAMLTWCDILEKRARDEILS